MSDDSSTYTATPIARNTFSILRIIIGDSLLQLCGFFYQSSVDLNLVVAARNLRSNLTLADAAFVISAHRLLRRRRRCRHHARTTDILSGCCL
jgi:hypothetical protein